MTRREMPKGKDNFVSNGAAPTDGQAPADELLFRVDEPRVAGRCPSCGRESLRATAGGHVVCTRLECPSPTAADDLLHGGPPPGLAPADGLATAARSVVDLMDRTADMPGAVRDVVDNLPAALSAAPADDTAAPGPVSHAAHVLRVLAGELRDGRPVWIEDGSGRPWRSEVAGWLEYHARQQTIAADDTAAPSRVRHAEDPLLHFARWVVATEENGAGPNGSRYGSGQHVVRRARAALAEHERRADDTAAPDLVVGKAGVPIDAYDAIQILAARPDHPSRLLAEKARAVADWVNDPPQGAFQIESVEAVAPELVEKLFDLLGGGPGDVSDVRPAGQPVRDSQPEATAAPDDRPTTVTVSLPTNEHDIDGEDAEGRWTQNPAWETRGIESGLITAWAEGVSIEDVLHDEGDVLELEETAHKVLAAVAWHRHYARAAAARPVRDGGEPK